MMKEGFKMTVQTFAHQVKQSPYNIIVKYLPMAELGAM